MTGPDSQPQAEPAAAEEAAAVFISAPSREEARRLARDLLERGLAACVQLAPIESLYVWDGAIQEEDEILLIVKTRAALFAALEARIREIHSYDTPEILALPVSAGSAPYLAWLKAATRKA